jgi:L-threonylcarbamoyladenylate synthase
VGKSLQDFLWIKSGKQYERSYGKFLYKEFALQEAHFSPKLNTIETRGNMGTKRYNIHETNDPKIKDKMIDAAAALLKEGKTVAFPTETVYGLGADATNEEAVAKVFEAKGRPQDNPLIAHVATAEQLKRLVDNLPNYVEKLIQAFSPGPLTYVLPSNGTCAPNVTAGLTTVAVRIPDHPVALKLLKACDFPLAGPSANLSGKPSPTTADHVEEDLAGRIAGILDGGPTGVGVESTVIACRENNVAILRPGGITKQQLEKYVSVVDLTQEKSDKPASPGMKYKHYAPEIPLWLVYGDHEKLQETVNLERNKGKKVAVLATEQTLEKLESDLKLSLGKSMEEVAHRLYDNLRKLTVTDADLIIAESFKEEGLGVAVMNRLKKAATTSI